MFYTQDTLTFLFNLFFEFFVFFEKQDFVSTISTAQNILSLILIHLSTCPQQKSLFWEGPYGLE